MRPLGLSSIAVSDGAIAVGAAVTNSQLAWHPVVRDRFPVLSEAILSGATTQIEIALTGAVAREHNHLKIELAKRTIVRAFAAARDANIVERRAS